MKEFSNENEDGGGALHHNVKIIHLIIDEKFLDFSFKVFQELEVCECVENRYVALVGERTQNFKHIADIPLWRVAGVEYANSAQVLEDLEWCDVLVVHWWHAVASSVVERASKSTIVVWSGWGGDYYDLLPGGEDGLYGEKTKELMRQIQGAYRARAKQRRNGFSLMMEAFKNIPGKSARNDVADKKNLIKRFDYFSAPIPEDFEQLKAALGNLFRAEYVQLSYGSVEKTFLCGECGVSGNDILLGNSATGTNNHLEILDILSSIEIGDRKVIAPLSYGLQEYGDEIEKRGGELLGDHFVPIRNYMPLKDYNFLISSCSIAIMNHRRQQALGNIAAMLYRGAKVFLDENSVAFQFFRRKGAYVFSVREIAELGVEAFVSLNLSEMKRNAEIINKIWGHDVVIDNARKFVGLMRQRLNVHQ